MATWIPAQRALSISPAISELAKLSGYKMDSTFLLTSGRSTSDAKRGLIQPYLKTKVGEREVDLCSALAKILRDFVGNRKGGFLFRTSAGAQLLQTNTLRDSLHPILEQLEHVKGGFNIFRRYRITYLQKKDCPVSLRHFWSGHASAHVSERYTKLREEREHR